MLNKHVKRQRFYWCLGKVKLKLQRDDTRYPLEWLKLKRQAILSIGKSVEQLELS